MSKIEKRKGPHPHGVNRWIFEIPLADVQDWDITPDWGADKLCCCCGRPIKQEKHMVHMLTSGNLVSSDQDFDNSQGFFPIGSECLKRLPNNFIFTLHQD